MKKRNLIGMVMAGCVLAAGVTGCANAMEKSGVKENKKASMAEASATPTTTELSVTPEAVEAKQTESSANQDLNSANNKKNQNSESATKAPASNNKNTETGNKQSNNTSNQSSDSNNQSTVTDSQSTTSKEESAKPKTLYTGMDCISENKRIFFDKATSKLESGLGYEMIFTPMTMYKPLPDYLCNQDDCYCEFDEFVINTNLEPDLYPLVQFMAIKAKDGVVPDDITPHYMYDGDQDAYIVTDSEQVKVGTAGYTATHTVYCAGNNGNDQVDEVYIISDGKGYTWYFVYDYWQEAKGTLGAGLAQAINTLTLL